MKRILKVFVFIFAGLGLLVTLSVAGGFALVAFHEPPKLPKKIILSLDFTKEVREKAEGGALDLLHKGGDMDLREMLAALDLARKDPRVKTVIGNFRGKAASLAVVQELRGAIFRLRDAGKRTYAFSTSFGEFGPGDHAYYLASAFKQIWLQPLGLVGITGQAAQMPFMKEALGKIGAQADFLHRREYKSAMDMLTKNNFTPANAEMLNALLDDISLQTHEDLFRDRQLVPLALDRLIDQAPLSAQTALQAHLIDHIGYLDEIEDHELKTRGAKSKIVKADDYLSFRRAEIRKEDKGKKFPVIAYIHGVGDIVQDAEGVPSGGGSLISADKIVPAIQDAVEDKEVEAILLRLDSPGGSAVASESIRRAVEVAENSGVPVVVSMGGVAGSGAYWVASQADMIFADPATLTGSIGVIAGKMAGTEIWDKLGIHWGMITRGANADLWTITAPFTPEQRAKVDALVGETYDAFKITVANGRELDPDYVEEIAKGRVWTGQQAVALGLVDGIGGLYEAIRYSKSLLGVKEDDDVLLRTFPEPESTAKKIFKLLDRLGGLGADMQQLGRITRMINTVLTPWLDLLQAHPRDLRMPEFEPAKP
ncbi:MAG: signal peptide peptidase SppA [Proteobacteria bacterium]|nr:signal peptide peptidase SppA [Pseudomonadota bacterium]